MLGVGAVLAAIVGPPAIDVTNGLARAGSSCVALDIIDGDTLRVFCPDMGVRSARIKSYDAPERLSYKCFSEFLAGWLATQKLRSLLWTSGEIVITPDGSDRYGRLLVYLRAGGKGVARSMIESGHGRAYSGGRRAGWCA
ncbi:thermonuclease family protein [Litoreibacter arenae DSM 19593]|uniref:Thermonuclease family protein n=1 Tax=Litoreibacter arenae DSM 19593 TaxID=1123360 RepID=S9S0Z4_9RHOB|nr:thermonuclease family protein [Litoreibacter arenae DSM 19593]